MELRGRRVVVTGGGGFLGQHVAAKLCQQGANVLTPSKTECDLTHLDSVTRYFSATRPDVVVHAAGLLGGIRFSQLFPADVFRTNLLMVSNILEAAHQHEVARLVNIGSACAYPDQLEGPYQEKDLLSGPMHPSVQYYGFSKRALYLGAKAYKEQYGLHSIHLVLANLFGPGDKFDPELSHVVSSMIPRFYEAVKNQIDEVVCWGTGQAIREFLYVEDCAEAIARAIEVFDDIEPLNIGTGKGTAVRELAELIGDAVGFKGRIVWDRTKSDGALCKVVDVSKMRKLLQFEPRTSLRDGLQKTVEWFATHYDTWMTQHPGVNADCSFRKGDGD